MKMQSSNRILVLFLAMLLIFTQTHFTVFAKSGGVEIDSDVTLVGTTEEDAHQDFGSLPDEEKTVPALGDSNTGDSGTYVAYDSQPASMQEVQAAIDAYNAAYSAAFDTGGFAAALEIAKPHWKHEVYAALMPSGYRCDLVDWDTAFGISYYTFFPKPAALATTVIPPGSTSTDLQNVINAAVSGDAIEISSAMFFVASAVTVPAGKSITIRSTAGNAWTLSQSSNRHFLVDGTLTLENIILDGGSARGGVEVKSGGTLAMESGVVIRNCISATSGGGVYVFSGGTFNMNGGTISDNKASGTGSISGGSGVYIASSGAFNMNDGVIRDNTASMYGGGVYIGIGSVFTMDAGTISGNTANASGGGVYVYGNGSFHMKSGTVSGNTANTNGGGVYVGNDAVFTMDAGTISGNTTNNAGTTNGGGGVYLYGTAAGGGTFNMNGGVIQNNSAQSFGGGVFVHTKASFVMNNNSVVQNNATNASGGGGVYVYVNGSFYMKNGTISDNTANTNGGGVYIGNDSTFTMDAGIISGNTANISGGGVYLYKPSGIGIVGGTFSMNNGTVSGNAANTNGGGVCVANDTAFTMGDGMISGNTAGTNGGGVYVGSNAVFIMDNGTIDDNGGQVILNSTPYGPTNNGGGIYVLSAGTVSITGISGPCSITGNHAVANGGGIYTANTIYSNLISAVNTVFSSNNASCFYTDATPTAYPSIQSAGVSIGTYVLNNFDINYTGITTQYNVAYNLNGGTQESGNWGSYMFGTGLTLPTNPTKTGFVFDGWYDNSGLMGTAVTSISMTAAGHKEYWAKWNTASYYTVVFNANGGSAVPSQTIIHGSTVAAPTPAPTLAGHTFAGWFTDDITFLSQWNFTAHAVTGSMRLYAKWTAKGGTGTVLTRTLTVSAPTFDSVAIGYVRPEAKSITISNSGNSTSNITNVTVSGSTFEIGGNGSTVAANSSITTWTVRPVVGLNIGTYTGTITVTYDGGATATATVSFTVNSGVVGGVHIYILPIHPTADKQSNLPKAATMTYTGTVRRKRLTFTITKEMVQVAIDKLGSDSNGIALAFVITNSSSYNCQTINITERALDLLKSSGVKYVQAQTGIFRFRFDSAAIKSLDRRTTGTISVTANPAKLSGAAATHIGSRPAFNVKVRYKKADGKMWLVTGLGSGIMTRGIKYTPSDNESTDSLRIVYVGKDGKPQWVNESSYSDGWVNWAGSSCSVYGVGYVTSAPESH